MLILPLMLMLAPSAVEKPEVPASATASANAASLIGMGVGGGVGLAAWREASEEPRPSLRGVVVHVEGTLLRVNPQTVPAELEQAGITSLYEGWVLDRHNPRQVWYLVFTDLPQEIRYETNKSLEAEVEFDGYYLKVMRYEALGTQRDPGRPEEAVVVIGRAPLIKSVGATGRDP